MQKDEMSDYSHYISVRDVSTSWVQDYVTNGLESELIDPDGGANIERKHHELATACGSVVDLDLTVSFPKDGWTKSLKKLLDPRFPAICQQFMEKSLIVSARMSLTSVGDE